MSANEIDVGHIRNDRVRNSIFFELLKDLCELAGWTKRTHVVYTDLRGNRGDNYNLTRPGPNLSVTKHGTRWSYHY